MQFDVFYNQNPETKSFIPYLLDIQANLLSGLSTRVVVPLAVSKKFGAAMKHLHPVFTVENKQVVMVTNELAGISEKILGAKVASLVDHRQEIIAALDFVFTGI